MFYRRLGVYNPQGLVEMKPRKILARGRTDKGSFAFNYIRGSSQGLNGIVQTCTNYPRNVLEFASETNCHHPTQKPIALFEYLIRTYTNEGETVLDNTCGSGTTGVACKRSGRNFIQMDLSEEYCAIARKRYEDNMWKVPYRVPDGQKRLL